MISIANLTQTSNVNSSFQYVHYETTNIFGGNLSSQLSNFDSQNISFKTNSSAFENFTEYAEVPYYIKATSMTFCILIMCLGVIGNVMVPIVILKTKDMRNSTNIFLVNLSIADLLVLLVCTPTVLVEVNSKPETWVLGKELCLAVPFVELTVAHASVLTILAISFERYYAICEPLRAGYVCTKTRATLICALAWFFAALFTSPILGIAEHHRNTREDGTPFYQCLTQAVTYWQIAFFIMVIIFLYILPLIILIVLYSVIAKNLISAASKVVMNKTVDPYNARARRQVILMLGTVVLCFFLCLMPYRILALWIIVTPSELSQEISPEKWYNLLYFSRIMLYINSAINPILYNLMSSKFRIGFCKVCICYKKSKEMIQNRAQRTVTNGSTTSSSLSRTTNSLKKLFSHRTSIDRSDVETDKEKDVDPNNKPNNFIERIFTNRTFLRQQSAPEYANPKESSILTAKSESVLDNSDVIEEDVKQAELREINVKIYHSTRKFSDYDHNHSLRRSVLINSAKSKSVENEGSANFVYKKVKVDCVVGFQKVKKMDHESPESFV